MGSREESGRGGLSREPTLPLTKTSRVCPAFDPPMGHYIHREHQRSALAPPEVLGGGQPTDIDLRFEAGPPPGAPGTAGVSMPGGGRATSPGPSPGVYGIAQLCTPSLFPQFERR
eukprot:gene12403-15594_t